jgi:C4-type Zn-finger protein
MSKRIKFPSITGETIDFSNFWADKLKREEQEEGLKRKTEEQEVVRINEIKCPLCKSTDKIHHIKRNNNGIMGSGFSSCITEEYLICKSCGIHYNDITKLK